MFARFTILCANIRCITSLSHLTPSFNSYPIDSDLSSKSAIFFGILSDCVEHEAQAFNLSRRLLQVFQMRVGPTLWVNGILGTQRQALDAEGKRMAQLFDIICQNFECNMDSMLGLHEDISSRHVGPTYLEELCSAWKEFLDSLPTPRLALQAPSRSSWTGRPQEKQHEDAGHSVRVHAFPFAVVVEVRQFFIPAFRAGTAPRSRRAPP